MTLNRVAIPSPNYSSRGGSGVRLIVLHTAEGALTYQSLGSYFQGDVGASSHAGIDDTPNEIGVFVKRADKSWTQANANPYSVSAELCAFAEWDNAEWQSHPNMLSNAAQWIAEEAAAFGIPIVELTEAQAQGGAAGVCQHVDLGAAGGGHWDCGPGFPMAQVLSMATGGAPSPTPPGPTPSPGGPAPPFPYPASDYLGQPSPDPHCHSGYYGGVDQANVSTWQAQMKARGWDIDADGMYGPSSENVCRQFQQEKGLSSVDGLVGPETWQATWTAPVT
jgi:Putative peptidoglycan binding domain